MEPTKDTNLITGIHHVTAISGDAQQNIDFYTGILGLKLVKQTVNFDYPEVYHFYFGDNTGAPGSIMTTFPYGAELTNGRHGKGKVNTTAFSLPYHAVDYWTRRLEHFDLLFKHPQERFSGNEVVIYLEDPDGMGVELIFNESDKRPPITTGAVPNEYAIQGIHHVELWLESFERTAALLTERMNHTLIAERSGRFRYGGIVAFTGGLIGKEIDRSHYGGNFEKTPIFFGTSDPDFHVPVERVYASANLAREMNGDVTEKVYPNRGHTISEDEIEIVNRLIFQ